MEKKTIAVPADKGNMNNLNAKKSSEEHRKELEREEARKTAKKIEGILLKMPVKAGENGKVFGSVTTKEIAEALDKQYQIKVDKKKIMLEEPIKTLGMFSIEIKLYEAISTKLKISILAQ